jgi:hypothetical protein
MEPQTKTLKSVGGLEQGLIMNIRTICGLIFLFSICPSRAAPPDSQGTRISTDATENPLIDNLNLSGHDFWILYQSPDLAKRRIAQAYLMGVLDSSERKVWCSYTIASPDALQEQTYIEFKKATPSTLKQRASEVIVEIFSRKLPCRSQS